MKTNNLLNHSAAHLLAAAVLKLYPGTLIGIGPAIDEGFYYDFKFNEPISESELLKIEKMMSKIVAGGYKFSKTSDYSMSKDQKFKIELENEYRDQGRDISFYQLINPSNNEDIFTDLCAGPHIDSVSKIKHFKLLSIAGAYWRGDSKNEQLTRIYGIAFDTKEELDNYLTILAERKERDHRKIGKDMNIFTFNQLSGQGFPIWLENGMLLKNAIQEYIKRTERKYGFREVSTPAFGEKKLYQISKHWDHYRDSMFPVIEVENEELIMRPMTCPHHILLFKMKRRSYKELPIRISEQAQLYRYEKSGALTGLERVRSMLLTEGHVFCRPDQIQQEFQNAYTLIDEVLKKFKIEIDYVSLSLRDPLDKEKYYDDDKMWNEAENSLRNVLKELNIPYKEMIGEAAFYGPKIDIQVKTVLGHEITLSTLQLDFLLPKRFEAEYINANEEWETPVLVHRGLIGTYERFISIILEQTKGVLPFWIAPQQVIILPVDSKHNEYAMDVNDKLFDLGFRSEVDDRNERLGKKMRDAQMSKAKLQIVIGDDEISNKTYNVRKYGEQNTIDLSYDELVSLLEKLKSE